MKRRDFLASAGVAAVGLSAFPLRWVPAAQGEKQEGIVLHAVTRLHSWAREARGKRAGFFGKTLIDMGKRAGFDVECSQDGSVFDGDLDQYNAIAFYVSGELTKPNKLGQPPVSRAGKEASVGGDRRRQGLRRFPLRDGCFPPRPGRDEIQSEVDPFIAMMGGEFVSHGPQQEAVVTVASPAFPGMEGIGDSLKLMEEWYALKNFPKDLHVILVQQTEGMKGDQYQRPAFPATWARLHGKGRVYYTSFGHRDDIWTNPVVQQIMLGGFAWAMGNVNADVTPNIEKVTPQANQLKL